MNPKDVDRWVALRQAITRTHEANLDQGVSGETVRIGIEALSRVEVEREDASMGDTGDGLGDMEEVDDSLVETKDDDPREGESVRRSGRSVIQTGKARALGDDGDEGEGEVDDDEEEEDATGSKEPQEKKKSEYLPYDSKRHFFWAQVVRLFSFSIVCYG
jgi:hypothetical protein